MGARVETHCYQNTISAIFVKDNSKKFWENALNATSNIKLKKINSLIFLKQINSNSKHLVNEKLLDYYD